MPEVLPEYGQDLTPFMGAAPPSAPPQPKAARRNAGSTMLPDLTDYLSAPPAQPSGQPQYDPQDFNTKQPPGYTHPPGQGPEPHAVKFVNTAKHIATIPQRLIEAHQNEPLITDEDASVRAHEQWRYNQASNAFDVSSMALGTVAPRAAAGSIGAMGGRFKMPEGMPGEGGGGPISAPAPAPAPAARGSAGLPNLRGMPVDEAIEIARTEPHLKVPAGAGTEGKYVGGPRDVKSKQGLNKIRKNFDEYVAADPRGGDWYDRYRPAVSEVTGGNPTDNLWMSRQHGEMSAGVSPEAELQFTLKENNAQLAGMPVKAARPAQHENIARAIKENDPYQMARGDKTNEYATHINPDLNKVPTATAVNDGRYMGALGYTTPDNLPVRPGNTSGQVRQPSAHKFMDFETALAVDRANKTKLGGRSDWTGEQIQAAPWVRQKALDIQSRNPKLTYEEAFARANTTIADFFDKHTAFATHEAVPGADTGHLPDFVGASNKKRAAYSADPSSTWATAPGGRDAIYGGMRLGDTGVAMRVRPSTEMQGMYTPPGGATELNPGQTARPLVAFDSKGGGNKAVAAADEKLLNAGEATRGFIDAQNASAWHKPWEGGQPGKSNSLFVPMEGKATPEQLTRIQAAGAKHGLPDVADTGRGVTVTQWWPPPGDIGPALRKGGLREEIATAVPGAEPRRTNVQGNLIDYSEKWKQGVGSGAATRELLEHVNATPEIRAALNNNPYIPQKALGNLERDEKWAAEMGATRADIQNARRIIGEGPGWIDRLEAGLKSGALLPVVAVAVLGPAALQLQEASPR